MQTSLNTVCEAAPVRQTIYAPESASTSKSVNLRGDFRIYVAHGDDGDNGLASHPQEDLAVMWEHQSIAA